MPARSTSLQRTWIVVACWTVTCAPPGGTYAPRDRAARTAGACPWPYAATRPPARCAAAAGAAAAARRRARSARLPAARRARRSWPRRTRRLDEPARLGGADDGGLGHGRVREQHALDVGRRHPLPGHLEDVVRAALVMIEAVGVAREQVARPEPAVDEGAARVVGVVPVAGARRRRADVQHARGAVGHRPALGVEQEHLGARH